jgi:hypothetical protein
VKFGTKNKDVPVYSGSDYIRTLKKGETTLRFLQECDDWVQYREHWTLEGKSFPCTKDRDTCPGCTHPSEKVSRSSRKYAVNVLLKPQDTHMVVKLPVTVANRFEARSERNEGTITNRDYIIIKSGEGLDTEYDVETGDKYEYSFSGKLYDIEEMLVEMYENATGESVDDQTPRAKAKEDIPPSKPQDQSVSADSEEEVVLTEQQLRQMDLFELQKVLQAADLTMPQVSTQDELVNYILEELAS